MSQRSTDIETATFSVTYSRPTLRPIAETATAPLGYREANTNGQTDKGAPDTSGNFIFRATRAGASAVTSAPTARPLFQVSFSCRIQ